MSNFWIFFILMYIVSGIAYYLIFKATRKKDPKGEKISEFKYLMSIFIVHLIPFLNLFSTFVHLVYYLIDIIDDDELMKKGYRLLIKYTSKNKEI